MSYPVATNKSKVGSYPASVKSGGGVFYDEVLEYRVWVHPENEPVQFFAFSTYNQALDFSKATKNAEEPLVLVYQEEYLDEPEVGNFIHQKEPRIAEWKAEWLNTSKGTKKQIPKFLKVNALKAT